MPQVNAILAEANLMKGLAAKITRITRDGDVHLETYPSGGCTVNLVIQKGKSKVDDAKLEKPKLEDRLQFVIRQIGKIEAEKDRGIVGRMADLQKYQEEEIELRAKINDLTDLIEGQEIETISFDIDECR